MTELEKFNLMLQGGYNPMGGGINTNQMNDFIAAGFRKPFDNKPVMQNLFNTQQFSQNVEDKKQADQRLKNQQLGNFLLAFSDTLRGVNPAQGVLQRQEIFQQQADERKAEEERNRILASMSDDVRKIFETYGPVAAFQYKQAQDNAEITALQKQREAQAFRDAGLDERSISLFTDTDLSVDEILKLTGPSENEQKIADLIASGLTENQAKLKVAGVSDKYVFEINKNGQIKKSIDDLDKEINEQYISSEGLQKIDQGFGLKDTIDNIANQALGPIVGTPAKDTNKAIAAKKVLNENLRERFVNQYSGRPSVYLNQRIDALLPQDVYMPEFDALQRYTEISRVLVQAKQELKENIESGLYEGLDLLNLQNEYKSTSILLKDLAVATGNLKGDEKVSLEQVNENFSSTGKYAKGQYDPVFLNNTNKEE
tara:strand:+ start:3703 stop:4983 length:1281 start_codon:yes stop_codon:yes gene_type:complete